MQRHLASSPSSARSGFSLIELLVAITIIAIVSAISLALVGRISEASRTEQTRTFIKAINSVLEKRIEAFYRYNLSRESRLFAQAYNAGSNSNPAVITMAMRPRVEAFLRQANMRGAFPMNDADLNGFDGVAGGGDDSPLRVLHPLSIATPADHAELLYEIIFNGPTFGSPTIGLDELDKRLIGDTDGDDDLELLDGWGQPLRFYRWPTRLLRVNGASLVPGEDLAFRALVYGVHDSEYSRDPADALNKLTPTTGFDLTTSFNLGATSVAGFAAAQYRDPQTYHAPLIVSAGPDESLGLHEPYDMAQFGHLAAIVDPSAPALDIADLNEQVQEVLGDNITNLQRGPK